MRKFGVTLMVGSLLWLGVMDSYAARPNRKPVTRADSASTAAGVAVSIDVLANDSDPDGNTITLNVVDSPGNGSTAQSGNAVIYTPAAGFSGNDSFSYNIKDSGGLVSSNTTVTVTVMPPPNTNPVANSDAASTTAPNAVTINLLANDTDADGDALSVTSNTQGSQGAVSISGGTATYTPNPGTSGNDSFGYTISDGKGGSASASVSVTVAPKPNTNPVANSDSASTTAPNAVTINLLANDTDADDDALSVTGNTQGSKGSVTRSGGSATYTPNAGTSGTDSFSYTISDGKGGSASATVSISVAPKPNTNPVANADSASTTAPNAVTINLLANDTDADGDALSVTSNTQGSQGSVVVSGGTATYTPNAGTSGTDSFSYSISDGKGGTSSSTVTVSVAPEPTTLTTKGGAVLSWTVPTTREDGSPMAPTDLAGYEIYVLAEATGESNVISVTDPLATQYEVTGLAPGVYYFSMAAKDINGLMSALSAVVSKTVGQ